MSTFLKLVKERKSIRQYDPKPIERHLIDQCLDAARLAPSACNSQPWSFIVIDNPETRDMLVKKSMSGIYASNKFTGTAPVIIVVITGKSKYTARLGGMIRKVSYNLIDIGIACDHLTLRAQELGIGTCYLGWFKEKAVKKVLNLPFSTHIDLMISMGYDLNPSPKEKNRKSLDEIRRYV